MATPNRPAAQNKYAVQYIFNTSYDETFGVITFEALGFDGTALQRLPAAAMAMKKTVVSSVTYLAFAAPGTAQSAALWQCQKIDETTGAVVTWADGNANFDNIATDLTALSYS